jgi:hypothetical protein
MYIEKDSIMKKLILILGIVAGLLGITIAAAISVASADEETECGFPLIHGSTSDSEILDNGTWKLSHPGNNQGIYELQCYGEAVMTSAGSFTFHLDVLPVKGAQFSFLHGRQQYLSVYYDHRKNENVIQYTGMGQFRVPLGNHLYEMTFHDGLARLTVDGVVLGEDHTVRTAPIAPLRFYSNSALSKSVLHTVLSE